MYISTTVSWHIFNFLKNAFSNDLLSLNVPKWISSDLVGKWLFWNLLSILCTTSIQNDCNWIKMLFEGHFLVSGIVSMSYCLLPLGKSTKVPQGVCQTSSRSPASFVMGFPGSGWWQDRCLILSLLSALTELSLCTVVCNIHPNI